MIYMPSTSSSREAAEGLRRDIDGVVGPRLRALVTYDAHGAIGKADSAPAAGDATTRHEALVHTVAIVENFGTEDLRRLAALAPTWEKRRLAVPLFLAPGEVSRSLDAFPLEFAQILAHYVVIAGDDPFGGIQVDRHDLRRACEAQVKSHALHLREGFLQAGGDAKKVGQLVAASAAPLRALLVNIARLHDIEPRSPDDLLEFLRQRLSLSVDGLRPIVLFGSAGATPRAPQATADAFPAYLQAVEDLAKLVDEWTR
jgi:hypothetical protein